MLERSDPSAVVGNASRLDAVRKTGLLDSPPELSFDRLTRLAAKLTGAPVTFISLVDEQRDFYKSCFGFPEPLASERVMTGTTFATTHFRPTVRSSFPTRWPIPSIATFRPSSRSAFAHTSAFR